MLLVALLPAPSRGDVPFVGVNAGAPISGNSILFSDALAADIASSGCRFVRINFIGSASGWDAARLAKYDTIIQNARNHNLQVLAIFSNETVWGYSQADWNQNYNTTGMNAYITAYAATAYLLIDRYKNDVQLYEIWNEPSCWAQDPNQHPLDAGCSYIWPRIFANMLAETYKECIASGGSTFFSDHGISLVSGGLFAHDIGGTNPSSGTAYAHDVYDQTDVWDAFEVDADNPTGRRYPWDYFGYHFYLNQGSAVSTSELDIYFNRNVSGHINDGIHTEQLTHGDSSSILVTEFGWTTEGVGDQGKADNLTDSYNWMRTQSFITSAMWYQYNCCDPNGNWGLTNGIGNPQLAWFAFADQCGSAGPPVANFFGVPLSGDAPLDVQFADASSGVIDTYHWDFGDSNTSGAEDPLHTYLAPGIYTVSLTVSGPGGSDSETKTDYVTVTEAPNPSDLDGDGDADLWDFSIFAQCFTGSGVTTVPSGCETESGRVSSPISAYATAQTLGELPDALSGTDLIHGLIGALEAGGFHDATPGGTAGGLADLTDGQPGVAAEAVLADFSYPSLQVRYDFSPPVDVAEIRVFAANGNGGSPNSRPGQTYQIEYSLDGDPGFDRLPIGNSQSPTEDLVQTGDYDGDGFGAPPGGDFLYATETMVSDSTSDLLLANVDSLRLIFYCVGNTAAAYFDPYDPGDPRDLDGQAAAFEATIVKEIDVLEYTGPPLVGNIADLDGDGDADVGDFTLFESNFTGPG